MRRGENNRWKDYLASRPVQAELVAIRSAIDLAGETGCSLHVVHVSCPEGIGLIAQARDLGLNVSVETCPHYLLLTERDLEQIGAPAKCAPPLRDEQHRLMLWDQLLEGSIDTLGSDHSPAPLEMKVSSDAFSVWGGIPSCQHGFLLVLDQLLKIDGLEGLRRFAALTAADVGARFNLPLDGSIAPGSRADLTLISFNEEREILAQQLRYRHKISPYIGRSLRAQVRGTWLRGHQIHGEGAAAETKPNGKMVKPKAAGKE